MERFSTQQHNFCIRGTNTQWQENTNRLPVDGGAGRETRQQRPHIWPPLRGCICRPSLSCERRKGGCSTPNRWQHSRGRYTAMSDGRSGLSTAYSEQVCERTIIIYNSLIVCNILMAGLITTKIHDKTVFNYIDKIFTNDFGFNCYLFTIILVLAGLDICYILPCMGFRPPRENKSDPDCRQTRTTGLMDIHQSEICMNTQHIVRHARPSATHEGLGWKPRMFRS